MSALSDLRSELNFEVERLDLWFSGPRSKADGLIFGNALDRLRHLLDDRDILDAPTTSEIIAHLDAGGTVQKWDVYRAGWFGVVHDVDWWRNRLAKYGDLPQPGYRCAPLPPATKRVPLHKLKGEKLPGARTRVDGIRHDQFGTWRSHAGGDALWLNIDIADDGTVEVQA